MVTINDLSSNARLVLSCREDISRSDSGEFGQTIRSRETCPKETACFSFFR